MKIVITLLGNVSKHDYFVSDLYPKRMTQFNLPAVVQSLVMGTGIWPCWMQPASRGGSTLTLTGPRSFHISNTCVCLPLTDFPPPFLLVFHHLFLLQCLFHQPTSLSLLFIIFRELWNYVAQLTRIFSKLRTGYELGLKRFSHEGSTRTAVDFNSPEVASIPVRSFSLDHRGCFLCGLRISINTKAAAILVKKKKKSPRMYFIISKSIFM